MFDSTSRVARPCTMSNFCSAASLVLAATLAASEHVVAFRIAPAASHVKKKDDSHSDASASGWTSSRNWTEAYNLSSLVFNKDRPSGVDSSLAWLEHDENIHQGLLNADDLNPPSLTRASPRHKEMCRSVSTKAACSPYLRQVKEMKKRCQLTPEESVSNVRNAITY